VSLLTVFPSPLLKAYTTNQAKLEELDPRIPGIPGPIFPLVLAMQKMNSPKQAGTTVTILSVKTQRSWYGRRSVNGMCASQ
jgi:hypothetical protein